MKTKRVAIWGLMLLLALLLAGCGGSSDASNASITITPRPGQPAPITSSISAASRPTKRYS